MRIDDFEESARGRGWAKSSFHDGKTLVFQRCDRKRGGPPRVSAPWVLAQFESAESLNIAAALVFTGQKSRVPPPRGRIVKMVPPEEERRG